ncbi:MAG TPA: NAD(P)/FAD-dependent oxidoreductase [Candidatus Dormibacteraeota bacterium]|nr:NAD(P)/FAD-dependent oxidoreductase [Candidatus Dormibacteraeota bacterium]
MNQTARYDDIVIGGGANGLVAATTLARAGRRVLLLEREEALGGQGRLIEFAPGFRAAPLGLDPGWLPPVIAAAVGIQTLERVPSFDAGVGVALDGSGFLSVPRDPRQAAKTIAPHSAADAAKWPEFVARLRTLAGFLESLYTTPAPDISASSLNELLPLLGLGRRFRALGRRDMIEFLRTLPLSVWDLLDDWFESAPLKAAVAPGGIQDHQQGPRSGGTAFVLLHYLVGAPAGSVRGRTPWRGGAEAFTIAAEQAARAAGVTIRTGAAVARIPVKADAIQGVVLENAEEIASSTVLSTANPVNTLLGWIDPVWLDPEFIRELRNVRHRGCAAIVLYALERLPDLPGLKSADALAGVISLTPTVAALEKAADAAKYGTVSERPHVEITVPTLLAPNLATGSSHVMVAKAQYAPHRLRDGAAWDGTRRDALAKSVTAAIEAVSPCFTSRILHQVTLTPLDLEERFGLREGAASQGELGLDQILFMRPIAGWGNHRTPIDGLFLGGAGSHPGPGILGGAGWLAAKRMLGDRRGADRRW